MRRLKITYFIAVVAILFTSNLKAQDPHLSQWQVSPMLINPAQTGYIEESNLRISANYRSQWASLGSNISTMALSYDKRLEDSQWAYGAYLLNNNLTDVFNNTSLVGSASYEITEPNNPQYHITAGVQLGLMYKKLDLSRLTFDNQYNDGNFDPDLPSNENLSKRARLMPETSLGAFYYNDNKEKDLRPFGGFGVMHLTQPKENFLDGPKSSLPVRWNIQAGAKWIKDKQLSITPYVMYMMQGTATELIGGASATYDFEDTEYRASLDFGYRVEDAIIIQGGFYIRDNWYRISYDIHVSPLKQFTRGRNALEFSATFTPKQGFLKKVKEVKTVDM